VLTLALPGAAWEQVLGSSHVILAAGVLVPSAYGPVAIGSYAIYLGCIDCADAEALGFGGRCGCGI
jgi:hypothetical protein